MSITPRRDRDGQTVRRNGKVVFRVRVWDPQLNRQVERTVVGDRAAKAVHETLTAEKRRLGEQNRPLATKKITFGEIIPAYLRAYATRTDGTPRPTASWRSERSMIQAYVVPKLGTVTLQRCTPDFLEAHVRDLRLVQGGPASPSTKTNTAKVIARLSRYAHRQTLINHDPSQGMRQNWGGSLRRRVMIPSLPQVRRLAHAMTALDDNEKWGDIVLLLAYTGLRFESEMIHVLVEDVDTTKPDWTLRVRRSKTEAGTNRVITISEVVKPVIQRFLDRAQAGRETRLDDPTLFTHLVNGERGGMLNYRLWKRNLDLAKAYTAAHPDGAVSYTAHELRHVFASLLIYSKTSDFEIARMMGHKSIETTHRIYGHLFAQSLERIKIALDSAITELYAEEGHDDVDEAA